MSSASLPPTRRGNRPDHPEADLHALLDEVLARFGCATGTIHLLDADSGLLHIRAQRGLSEELLARVREIPLGKGLAGLAAQRGEPVRVCNLQADTGGMARPAAKQTGMAGAIAVPMVVEGKILGVLGVAKPVEHEFDPEETARLLAAASAIGAALGG
jgi:putative methionine-R-sulfoxide reductase with GAF domain